MRNGTDKKKASIICAAVIIGVLGVFLATVLFPLLGESMGEMVAVGALLIYGLLIIAVIAGVVHALRERLREIDGGEEDEAKKY